MKEISFCATPFMCEQMFQQQPGLQTGQVSFAAVFTNFSPADGVTVSKAENIMY